MRNEPTPPISDLKFQISDLPCPHCGYDLRGTDSPRCPECGKPVNRQNPSPIPWSHRRAVGRVRAFARTAVMAAVHPRRLAAAVAGPVSLADALAFRRATAAVAAVALLVPLTVTAFLPDVGPLAGAVAHPLAWRAELLAVPVVWVGVWLAVHTSAGVCTYWFHPRSLPVEQQNRAVALAYYACGPLALLPVPIACGVLTAAAALYVDRYPRCQGRSRILRPDHVSHGRGHLRRLGAHDPLPPRPNDALRPGPAGVAVARNAGRRRRDHRHVRRRPSRGLPVAGVRPPNAGVTGRVTNVARCR